MRVSTSVPSVLVANLGAPAEPTPKAARRFFRQILSDRRVADTRPIFWRPLIEGTILPGRTPTTIEQYSAAWTEKGNPLVVNTTTQVNYLREQFAGKADVRYGRRYGDHPIGTTLDELHADGHRRLLVLPLFPQYSASTTASVTDEIYRWNLKVRDQFELRVIRSFPDFPGYIAAVVQAIEGYWNEHGRPLFDQGDRLILSYPAIANAMVEAGDPYVDECTLTSAMIKQMLGLPSQGVLQTYQSGLGKGTGLEPNTLQVSGQLGRQGTRRLDVVCPGFVSDCAETLSGINVENRSAFIGGGGEEFHHISWGGGSTVWLEALKHLVKDNLVGWV